MAIAHLARTAIAQQFSRVPSRALIDQEIHMSTLRTLLSLSSVLLITACATATGSASPEGGAAKADDHASHHPVAAAPAQAPAAASGQDGMKAMRVMHDKMMSAKTPQERQALMADHMKAMQDGMQMMKGMQGGMGDPKSMSADMAQSQKSMQGRMDMMQMMMDMMMQRVPAAGAPPAGK